MAHREPLSTDELNARVFSITPSQHLELSYTLLVY